MNRLLYQFAFKRIPCILHNIMSKDALVSDITVCTRGVAGRLYLGTHKPVTKRGSLHPHSPEPGQLPGTVHRSRILQGREYGGEQ
jgi:hypothetical protein